MLISIQVSQSSLVITSILQITLLANIQLYIHNSKIDAGDTFAFILGQAYDGKIFGSPKLNLPLLVALVQDNQREVGGVESRALHCKMFHLHLHGWLDEL